MGEEVEEVVPGGEGKRSGREGIGGKGLERLGVGRGSRRGAGLGGGERGEKKGQRQGCLFPAPL